MLLKHRRNKGTLKVGMSKVFTKFNQFQNFGLKPGKIWTLILSYYTVIFPITMFRPMTGGGPM